MSRRSRLFAAAVAGLALTTAVTSLLVLVALGSGGEARVGGVALMKLAAGYDRRAQPLVLDPATATPAARREAAALSRLAIRQYPYDTGAWLELAYIDRLDHGRLTPAGVGYLQRSYDLVAADPPAALWRIRFALENYGALTPALRTAVRDEVKIMSNSAAYRDALRRLAPTIRNPVGAAVLILWLI